MQLRYELHTGFVVDEVDRERRGSSYRVVWNCERRVEFDIGRRGWVVTEESEGASTTVGV
jgi:hypothetical protein